ncbi:MAG TPA: hypothetical protein VFX28_11205 [Methylomirabilota bacterium]|nr:hypothetical protein [Methylomirabilota bacterium]
MRGLVTLSSLAVLIAVHAPAGAQEVRHSGTLLAIDTETRTLTLEEVGPWQVKDGVTQTIRRTAAFTSGTSFAVFMRVNAPGGFAGDFIEVALEPEDFTPGEFVTVACTPERGRCVATHVTMVDPADPVP